MTEEQAHEPAEKEECDFCTRPRITCQFLFVNPIHTIAVCDNCVMQLTNQLYQLHQLAVLDQKGTRH